MFSTIKERWFPLSLGFIGVVSTALVCFALLGPTKSGQAEGRSLVAATPKATVLVALENPSKIAAVPSATKAAPVSASTQTPSRENKFKDDAEERDYLAALGNPSLAQWERKNYLFSKIGPTPGSKIMLPPSEYYLKMFRQPHLVVHHFRRKEGVNLNHLWGMLDSREEITVLAVEEKYVKVQGRALLTLLFDPEDDDGDSGDDKIRIGYVLRWWELGPDEF